MACPVAAHEEGISEVVIKPVLGIIASSFTLHEAGKAVDPRKTRVLATGR
jgi:hypothetical protein